MTDDTFSIRRITTLRDIETSIEWSAREGWNPGLDDARAFYAADPNGFFQGFLGTELIGVCHAVVYDSSFAFFGGYIVQEAYRHQGFGIQMTRARLDYIGARTAGLDGVTAMQNRYVRIGFVAAYNNIRHQGLARAYTPRGEIVELAQIDASDLSAYDRRYFPSERAAFLSAWIHQPKGAALGLIRNGSLTGYGVARPCRTGYKIAPLFAHTADDADTLFQALSTRVAGQTTFLDTPDLNREALALAHRYTLEPVFETARMYRGPAPSIDLAGIYGITSMELG